MNVAGRFSAGRGILLLTAIFLLGVAVTPAILKGGAGARANPQDIRLVIKSNELTRVESLADASGKVATKPEITRSPVARIGNPVQAMRELSGAEVQLQYRSSGPALRLPELTGKETALMKLAGARDQRTAEELLKVLPSGEKVTVAPKNR